YSYVVLPPPRSFARPWLPWPQAIQNAECVSDLIPDDLAPKHATPANVTEFLVPLSQEAAGGNSVDLQQTRQNLALQCGGCAVWVKMRSALRLGNDNIDNAERMEIMCRELQHLGDGFGLSSISE